ncbi:MAG: BrnT family toxin [bacterium]
MQFDWDPGKAWSNVRKHGLSFEEAATVFYDPFSATFDDPDHSDDESRFITVGYSSQNRLCVVVHTERESTLRIISARQTTAQERKRHEEETG